MKVMLKSDTRKPQSINVQSLHEASTVCRAYIERKDLPASKWPEAPIVDNGQIVAKVSYNGRIWNLDGSPCAF